MKTYAWLKKALVVSFLTLFVALPAHAFSMEVSDGNTPDVVVTDTTPQTPEVLPKVTDHSVTPQYFDPYDGTTTTISYCLDADAMVTVGIYNVVSSASQKVDVIADSQLQTQGCHSQVWNGKHGSESQTATPGETADYGDYFYGITIKPLNSPTTSDYVSNWIYLNQNGSSNGLEIIYSDVDNRSFDPWAGQEAELSFTISDGAYVTVKIEDEDNDTIVELIDNVYMEAGEHTVEWDGLDEYDDIADQGDYNFYLKIQKDNATDKVYESVRVKKGANDNTNHTQDPRIKNLYIAKDTFDPGRNESNYIVFTLTAEADLSVKIFDPNMVELEELLDLDDTAPGTYSVLWDGDLAINNDGNYTYEIYAQNSKGNTTETGKIKVEEDLKPGNRPNIYKDKVGELPYLPHTGGMPIQFKLEDRDADVTIEIKDGSKTIATVTDDQYFPEGTHTVYWDGRDKYGEMVDNGVFKYRIRAENNKGSDTEMGYFSVEGASYAQNPSGYCSVFLDVTGDNSYCEAIEWAYTNGVFQGYGDGSFKPNAAITRAESVKVILETLGVSLLPGGMNLGFKDTETHIWYNKYLSTAMSLGIVSGYGDNTFRPNNSVSRVEALKILLETGRAKDGLIIPSNTYGQPYFDTPNDASTKWYLSYAWFAKGFNLNYNDSYFYPNDNMTRAQMADLLYRYHLAQF